MTGPGQDSDTSELQVMREQGFFDRSRGVRLFIAGAFAVCLFVFIHFREVRVEVMELGSQAPKYIVAQIDFSFYDEEATIILRQEAVRDIGKIYRIPDNTIRQLRLEFENYLVSNQDWRTEAEDSTFDDMYRAIEPLEHALHNVRFTDPRTLRKMTEVGITVDDYQVYTPATTTEPVDFPATIWQHLAERAYNDETRAEAAVQFLLRYFKSKEWMIEEDVTAQRSLRKQVQSFVADKFTEIQAGQRIIDQGEKVTARHLAILQAMKRGMSEQRNLWHPETLAGSMLLTFLLIVISIAYLRVHCPEILASNRSLFLLVTIVVFTLLLSKVFEYLVLTSRTNVADVVRFPLFAPFAAILLCSLMNAGIAAYASVFTALVLSLTLATDRHGFLLTNIAAALVAIVSTRSLRRRKEIFIVCGQAWLACAVVIIALQLYENKFWNVSAVTDLFSSCIFMIATAVLIVGLLPVLEATFDILTDVTLMEYMDPNHELLRRLAIEAPGTYQHSVIVGNLSEAAACAIGANGLFCRVSTLYHDIGKLATPQYFTENQQGGMNIHQLLTPLESAQVIMAHVSEGVTMARKAGLPEPFIDIIKEHHGTTLVYYFYRKGLEQVEGDESLIDEHDFRYKGPRPRSKESAIIMIADSMEAASRSLDEINDETLSNLIDSLVRHKFEDGQFDECILTFEELQAAKRAMIKTLMAAGHSRVKYPERKKGEER